MKFKLDWRDKLAVVAMTVVVAFGAWSSYTEAHENIPTEVVEFFEDSVWEIHAMSDGDKWTGSAWHVTPEFLITNKHVTKGATKMVMKRENHHEPVDIEIVYESEVRDLALVYCGECVDMPVTSVYLGNGDVAQRGTMTWGGGYGKNHLSIHTGHTQEYDGWDLYTTTAATYGDSGSPEVFFEDGVVHLVGVRYSGILNVSRVGDGLVTSQVPEKTKLIPATWVQTFMMEVDRELKL